MSDRRTHTRVADSCWLHPGTNGPDEFAVLKRMAEDRSVELVIDSTCPLAETAAAMSHVRGHASGTLVITL